RHVGGGMEAIEEGAGAVKALGDGVGDGRVAEELHFGFEIPVGRDGADDLGDILGGDGVLLEGVASADAQVFECAGDIAALKFGGGEEQFWAGFAVEDSRGETFALEGDLELESLAGSGV